MCINAETDPTNLMDLFKQREELLNEKNTWEEQFNAGKEERH